MHLIILVKIIEHEETRTKYKWNREKGPTSSMFSSRPTLTYTNTNFIDTFLTHTTIFIKSKTINPYE